MSSEGSRTSSSSRLSQFGLYRTIDARTEEFLKLSKKRQIRRGCACAVISTAITVTVVVAVILIYEYSSTLDIKHEKESPKCVNATKNNNETRSQKVNRKLHTVNLSTVKLLNLLLRALNHTQHFENQMDDSPTTDKLVASEPDIPFERNVFSNSKNWIRIPSVRTLAAEHRDPSIFSYRSPTSNVKLTPRPRNTPPYYGMNLHSGEMLDKTAKSFIRKKYQANPIIMETTTEPPTSQKPPRLPCPDTDEQNKSCNCSKINIFMCRLLSNIQELFPEIILNGTSCIVNKTAAEQPKINATKPFRKKKVTKTPAPQLSKKSETTTSNYDIKIFDDDETTVQYITTESITEKYKMHLDNATVQFTPIEITAEEYQNNKDKTSSASVYSNRSGNEDAYQYQYTSDNLTRILQSIMDITTKQPIVTTTAVRTYVLAPDFIEYKLFMTTTPTKIRSQSKTAEKIQAKKSLEYEFELVHTNKTESSLENLVKNRNKTTNATKTRDNNKISDKKLELVLTMDEVTSKYEVTADTYKEYPKYSIKHTNKLSNTSKSGYQHIVQNKRPKILLKGQFPPVTTKSTTTTTRPRILAPEIVKYIEPFIITTTSTTTSTVASTTKQNKINFSAYIQKALDKITQSIERPTHPSTTAKHFIDNPYVALRPFNKIKFARFDSLAANPNKRVNLPLYKDINFDLFPIYKRHNTPKFDSIERKTNENIMNSDNLNNSGPVNDWTYIQSSSKKNYNESTLNILPINSSKFQKNNHSAADGTLAFKMVDVSSEEKTKEEISENYKNDKLSKTSSIEEKHAIWTYTIDNDYDENKTKNIVDSEIKQYETLNKPNKELTLLDDTKINKSVSAKRTLSLSQLHDADESLLNYLSRMIQTKTEEKDEHQLNNTSHTVEAKFFEDRIQEKLMSHMDTTPKIYNDTDNDKNQSVIPIEELVDETKYNPLSMLPKSRPSYLEINRNFLGDDYEQDHQIKENSKQKRQDYDILFDLYQ